MISTAHLHVLNWRFSLIDLSLYRRALYRLAEIKTPIGVRSPFQAAGMTRSAVLDRHVSIQGKLGEP
jgi:hypothetical protein